MGRRRTETETAAGSSWWGVAREEDTAAGRLPVVDNGGKFTLSETFDTFRHFSTLVDTSRHLVDCRNHYIRQFDTFRHLSTRRMKFIFIPKAYSGLFYAKQFDLCVADCAIGTRAAVPQTRYRSCGYTGRTCAGNTHARHHRTSAVIYKSCQGPGADSPALCAAEMECSSMYY